MLDVHQKGRAVVSSGAREQAEWDVSRLHAARPVGDHAAELTMALKLRIRRTRKRASSS